MCHDIELYRDDLNYFLNEIWRRFNVTKAEFKFASDRSTEVKIDPYG